MNSEVSLWHLPELDLQPFQWLPGAAKCSDFAKQRCSGDIPFSGYVGKEAFLSVLLFLIPVVWFCDYTAVSSENFTTTLYLFQEFHNQHTF